ncbi:hypothetical protein BRADI_5g15442v3 [Brachypodium distachyon]|uniref:Reverse transcriptase zinc-binding domain-containing protein n=1 Tax=Brachypodium distachyon TaxID=15368 RepID=A0A2K2CHE8_BRADI|nr:hypothetical protein BRADI_5g15442v3 [Brachypodium distachyon]
MPIYSMLSPDLPMSSISAIEKLCRGFLWKERREARGGHCLVARDAVCAPKRVGGLGIPNLRLLNLALKAKWCWQERTEPWRSWQDLGISVPAGSVTLFEATTSVILGNGAGSRFWSDPWLAGERIKEFALDIIPRIEDGLLDPNLTSEGIRQFLLLWDKIADVELGSHDDFFHWKWTSSGNFSVQSAYLAFFEGRTEMVGHDLIRGSKAPSIKCKFFVWLACRGHCWTADRLARRGLDHPARCPLCDQDQECVSHLLLGCSVARLICWQVLILWGRPEWLPRSDASILEWWPSIPLVGKERKDFETSSTLVYWSIWKHRNSIVFDHARVDVVQLLHSIGIEAKAWTRAGLFRGSSFAALPREWRDNG